MEQILQIRTNSNFSVNYQDLQLTPEMEIIFLTTEPTYAFDGDDYKLIKKEHHINEHRMKINSAGLDNLLKELHRVQDQFKVLHNMQALLNPVITENLITDAPEQCNE